MKFIKVIMNWIASHVVAKVLIGALLLIFAISTTIINHDELAIKTRFGKTVSDPLEPGLHFVFPFMDEVRRHTTTIQSLLITDKTISSAKTFEEVLYQEGVDVTTKDNVDTKVVLEVFYAVRKDPETVDRFVETFGRLESAEVVLKIERLIADTTRQPTRSILTQASLRDAESKIIEYGATIRALANDPESYPTSDHPELQGLFSVRNSLQRPHLSEIGVEIHRFGYRIQPSASYTKARETDAIRMDGERSRLMILEEQVKADKAEYDQLQDHARQAVEMAALKKQEYDALPDGTTAKLLQKLSEKWDGSLPGILYLDAESLRVLSSILDRPETTPQFSTRLNQPTAKSAEQDGSGQPATRPESR